tara:strand:+ start:392 stop:544 length:153 start_codon:yes stop_codon:yes gene_type:complete
MSWFHWWYIPLIIIILAIVIAVFDKEEFSKGLYGEIEKKPKKSSDDKEKK